MSQLEADVALTRMVKPKFLSLVGKPANKIAFKVVRSEGGEEQKQPYLKRSRAKRFDPLLAITFEEGLSEEEVQAIAEAWGLTGYTLQEADNRYTAVLRNDDAQPTITVALGQGRTATILKPISQHNEPTGLSVVRIDFAKDYYETEEEVTAWLSANSVDFQKDALQNADTFIAVERHEAGDYEYREVEVEPGITFVIKRVDAAESDIPDAFVAVVNDAAFGMWGWGQLDFAAALADVEFCNMGREAMYQLTELLDRIMFYSDLPVAVRKELLLRATGEFAAYIGTLLDALPTKVVIATRSSIEKEKLMKTEKATQAEATAQRTDAEAAAAEAAATEPTDGSAGNEPQAAITRADVEAMIAAANAPLVDVLNGLKEAITGMTAQRSDAAEPAKDDKADPLLDAVKEITRSVSDLGTAIKAVNDRVANIESTTAVRSDMGDGQQSNAKRDVFQGVFNRSKPE